MIRKSLVVFMALLMTGFIAKAQQQETGQNLDYNVISTAVPFMIIAPDARSAGMGDIGVSTSPDVYSMHWNPAKYAFMEDDFSIGLAYSPWLRKLVPDMNIAYLAVSKRVSKKSTIAGSLKYFSLGEINFRDEYNNDKGTYSPNEFSVDLCYSRKLGDYLSASVAGRFIYSHLTQGVTNYSRAAWSIAADIAVYYQRPVYFNTIDGEFSWGVAITNMGSKMSYTDANSRTDFIPTNLRLGPSLKLNIDEFNSLAFSFDLNKLLVPTPPIYAKDADGALIPDGNGGFVIEKGKNPNVSMLQGMFQSFYDAPGGFSEELKEITIGIGAEYWYNKIFAVRAGFFHESKMKGNRRYLTFGAGLRYNVFALDVSYLVPVNNSSTSGTNPLEGTLRFDLTFNINKWGANTKLEKVD
ncbi:MAG: type IX secretion system outer membrane channel protein PorV [Bacteroidales bacterium]|nr:type IX secretion system outer membrane channel protein PorV [Bacteroidales bacterium]